MISLNIISECIIFLPLGLSIGRQNLKMDQAKTMVQIFQSGNIKIYKTPWSTNSCIAAHVGNSAFYKVCLERDAKWKFKNKT